MKDKIQPLAIQKYVNLSRNKEIISFAAGLPDLSVLPIEKLKNAYTELLEEKHSSFQYQPPVESLKKNIQKLMLEKNVSCDTEEILITNGAQQAIYLTANLFLTQQAPLLIDEFVYPGFLQIANLFDLEYLLIFTDLKDGLNLNVLETLLKKKKPLPFLYIVSNGHNPLGITMSNESRENLAYLAEKYHFIIVEDDPYGFLNYTNESFLPLRAYTKNAIYIGSFSKIIAPVVRVGWIVGDHEIIKKLHQLKDMNDLYMSNPNHLVVNNLLENNCLNEIIEPQKNLYKRKRDCMITALKKYLKIPYRYSEPKHGMFLWLEFSNADMQDLQQHIFEKSKVIYIPENAFSVVKNTTKQAIRLNFTYPSFTEIELGMKNLCAVLNECVQSEYEFATS